MLLGLASSWPCAFLARTASWRALRRLCASSWSACFLHSLQRFLELLRAGQRLRGRFDVFDLLFGRRRWETRSRSGERRAAGGPPGDLLGRSGRTAGFRCGATGWRGLRGRQAGRGPRADTRVIDVERRVGVLRQELRLGDEEHVVAARRGFDERRFLSEPPEEISATQPPEGLSQLPTPEGSY